MRRSTRGGKAPAGRLSLAPRRHTECRAASEGALVLVISYWHFVKVNWREQKETHVGGTRMLCWEPLPGRQGPAPSRAEA